MNEYLCGIIVPFLLLIVGLAFAFKYRFFYILHPIKTTKEIVFSRGGFRSLCIALAGTLGVGNIVGVASAIISGGYGAVFWMWVSAILAMSVKYAEVSLSIKFRRSENGRFYGGAPYYIYDGLKNRIGKKAALALSLIFSFFCVVNSLTTGNLVQVNSISSLLPISPLAFGLIFAFLILIVIIGGRERIGRFSAVTIPILSVFYVVLSLSIIFANLKNVPSVLLIILKDAFSVDSAVGGVLGFGISSSIRYGVSRGLLSNEAGCGTSPLAHASSNNKNAHTQGCLGIFEVFVDTILLCTLTAFVIILSGNSSKSPVYLVVSAFGSFLGGFGEYSVLISCILFAFATICTQFFYGNEALTYISRGKAVKTIFTAVFIGIIIVGAIIPMSIMWEISDLTIAIMTIFNLICLCFIKKAPMP